MSRRDSAFSRVNYMVLWYLFDILYSSWCHVRDRVLSYVYSAGDLMGQNLCPSGGNTLFSQLPQKF